MTAAVTGPFTDTTLGALCAEGRFSEALALFREGADPWFASPEAGHLAATAAARLGRFGEAWSLASAALTRFTQAGDRPGRLRVLNLMGGVSFERGSLAQAETAFRNAARLAEDLSDVRAAARAWSNLGILAHLRQDALEAMDLLLRAGILHGEEGDARGLAQVHHNVGLALRDLGEYDRAEAEVAQAVHWADQAWDPPLRSLVMLGRAELAMARGNLDEARRDLVQGRELAASSDDQCGIGEAFRVESLLALREGNFAAARIAAREGMGLATTLGADILAIECRALHALALSGQGLLEEAIAEQASVMRRLERLDAPRLAEKIEEAWSRRPCH